MRRGEGRSETGTLKMERDYIGHVYTVYTSFLEHYTRLRKRSGEGVVHPKTGEKFNMVCLSITGDWAFLVKIRG